MADDEAGDEGRAATEGADAAAGVVELREEWAGAALIAARHLARHR